MIIVVHRHVMIGQNYIVAVMRIGHQTTVTALIHQLEKSKTIAGHHVAIVTLTVSNLLNDRKFTTNHDTS